MTGIFSILKLPLKAGNLALYIFTDLLLFF